MAQQTVAGVTVDVDDEGFMTNPDQWTEAIGTELAKNIDVTMNDEAWAAITFMRNDFKAKGESPTIRRMTNEGGFDTKKLFALFPKKPAKKMAYIAGVPKPKGCV